MLRMTRRRSAASSCVASNDVPRVDEGRMIRLPTCPRASRLLCLCNRSRWIGLIADDWLPLRLPSGTGEALLGSCGQQTTTPPPPPQPASRCTMSARLDIVHATRIVLVQRELMQLSQRSPAAPDLADNCVRDGDRTRSSAVQLPTRFAEETSPGTSAFDRPVPPAVVSRGRRTAHAMQCTIQPMPRSTNLDPTPRPNDPKASASHRSGRALPDSSTLT